MIDVANDSGNNDVASPGGDNGAGAGAGGDGIGLKEYAMNKPNRGVAIIINNVKFTYKANRVGSDVDKRALKQRFKELEFDVIDEDNLTGVEIENLIKRVAGQDHTNNDCFMCAILSHGEENKIWGVNHGGPDDDDDRIDIQKLIAPFKGDKCKSLAGKPKIFFIQACRGSRFDPGVEQPDTPGSTNESAGRPIESNVRIPTEADFFIMYSVVTGYLSVRNPKNGSWFVQAINKVFKENGKKLDLMTLMTEVNDLVAHEFEIKGTQEKQMPCISSMLTKAVYFRPKI